MADERLVDFPSKTYPNSTDILYVGDSLDSYNEVKSTIGGMISGYSNALASIAGLTTAADQTLYLTAPNVYAVTSLTAFGRALIASTNANDAQIVLSLVPGINVQAYSAALQSISGLTTSPDLMIYTTGSNVYATTSLTTFGRSLVDDADAIAARTTLELGTAATKTASDNALSMVASVSGPVTIGHIPKFIDVNGTFEDGGSVITTTLPSGQIIVGNVSNIASNVTMSGDATLSNLGALTLANSGVSAGSYTINGVTFMNVDVKGRVTSASNITVGSVPSGAAGGDLSGTYPNPTVAKINGATLGTTTATSGNLLIGSGTTWETNPLSGDATITSVGVLTVSKIGGKSISLANSFTTSGNFTVTQTYTGNTNVTFPTSGTLATTSLLPTFPLLPSQGGTGVSNSDTKTITLGGPLVTSGANSLTLTTTGTTNVTLPTSGTLALAGNNTDITSLTGLTGSIHYPGEIILESGGFISPRSSSSDYFTIGAGDLSTSTFIEYIRLTTLNTSTCDLNDRVTKNGLNIYRGVTLNTNGVMYGTSTLGVSSTTAATTGQLLVGTTSSPPSFSSSSNGNFAFTSATSGVTRTLTISNTSNTASSKAVIVASVAGASADDPVFQSIITGVTTWSWGADNSASDSWVLSASATLGTSNALSVNATSLSATFSGDITATSSTSGSSRGIIVEHTSNTTSSDAYFKANSGGASGGDAYTWYTNAGTQSYVAGLDNSDSDAFVISASAVPGTTNAVRISTAGLINYPLQCAFNYINGTLRSNVVGLTGTIYTIPFNNLVFNQSATYNTTTGVFTASVTGKYFLKTGVQVNSLTVAMTSVLLTIVTSNNSYQVFACNGANFKDSNNNIIIEGCIFGDMDAADTASVTITIGGGTNTCSIPANNNTHFMQYLVV